MAKSVLAMWRP